MWHSRSGSGLFLLAALVGCSGDPFASSTAQHGGAGGGARSTDAGQSESVADGEARVPGTGGRAFGGSGGRALGGAGSTGAGSGGAGSGGRALGGAGSTGTGGADVLDGGWGAGGTATADGGHGPRWCEGKHALLCEDFDSADAADVFLDTWTTSSTISGAFSFDTSATVPSPPNALRVRSNSDVDVNTLVVKTLPRFATPPSKIRLEFELRIDSADGIGPASGAAFATIVAGTKPSDGFISMEVAEGPVLGVGYYDPTTDKSDDGRTVTFPAENTWLGTYAVEVIYSGSGTNRTGCAQAYAKGVALLDKCVQLPKKLLDPPVISVGLGVLSVGLLLSGNVQVRFDNVLLTAQ